MIKIKFSRLATLAYLYMVLPIIIFFVTWLKWYLGITFSIVLLYGLFWMLKTDYFLSEKQLFLPAKHLFLVLAIFLVWLISLGQGGLFVQSGDWHCRNALFRDLTNYNWPIKYPTGYSLNYYFMHWILPALFGKLFGWFIGNMALLIWTYIGIVLSYLLILCLLNNSSLKAIWTVCILFITFSGLNNIGASILDIFGQVQNMYFTSNEGWLDVVTGEYGYHYLYASNHDDIAQTFNQTVTPWIVVPLLFENKRPRNFAFMGLCVLPFAPLPFIGFIPMFLVLAFNFLLDTFKTKNYKILFFEFFSIPNISSIFSIFIVFFTFFSCNTSGGKLGLYVPLSAFDLKRIIVLILFYLVEFGIYMLFLYKTHKKDLIFYTIIFSLVFIPIFKIGVGRDFCMRVPIPMLFYLMIMLIEFIITNFNKMNVINALIIIVLTIGGLNVFYDEVIRFKRLNTSGSYPLVLDDIKTFGDMNPTDLGGEAGNYLLIPKDQIFYKFFCKQMPDDGQLLQINSYKSLLDDDGNSELFFSDKNNLLFYDKNKNLISKLGSNIDKNITLGNQFNIEVIFKPYNTQPVYSDILSCHSSNSPTGFCIEQDGSRTNYFVFFYGNGSTWTRHTEPFKVKTFEWQYLSVSFDSLVEKEIKIYLDGDLIVRYPTDGDYVNGVVPLTIGNWVNKGRLFNGEIKEISIQDLLISHEDVKSKWEYIRSSVRR